jgi:hypothetical protein
MVKTTIDLKIHYKFSPHKTRKQPEKEIFLHTKSLAGPESLIDSKTLEKEM